MRRDDEQGGLGTAPELEPSDEKVTCRLKPDRRRQTATLDDWAHALKDSRARHSQAARRVVETGYLRQIRARNS